MLLFHRMTRPRSCAAAALFNRNYITIAVAVAHKYLILRSFLVAMVLYNKRTLMIRRTAAVSYSYVIVSCLFY